MPGRAWSLARDLRPRTWAASGATWRSPKRGRRDVPGVRGRRVYAGGERRKVGAGWGPFSAPPPPHGPWARTPPGCRRPAPPEPPPRRRRRPARGTLGNAGRGGAGTRGSGNSGRGGGDRPAGRPASAVASREAHVGSGQAPQFCGAPQRVRPELGGDRRRPVGCGTRLRGRACACRAQGGAPRGTGPRLTPVPTQAPGQ